MREVLGDEIYLARSLELEELRLADYVIAGERAVPSPHERDGAERAAVVASFTDLEVANVRQITGVLPHSRVKRNGIEGANSPLSQSLCESTAF